MHWLIVLEMRNYREKAIGEKIVRGIIPFHLVPMMIPGPANEALTPIISPVITDTGATREAHLICILIEILNKILEIVLQLFQTRCIQQRIKKKSKINFESYSNA